MMVVCAPAAAAAAATGFTQQCWRRCVSVRERAIKRADATLPHLHTAQEKEEVWKWKSKKEGPKREGSFYDSTCCGEGKREGERERSD